MSKIKKEELIQSSGDLSQSKVKSYSERENIKTKNPVSKVKDITFNQLQIMHIVDFLKTNVCLFLKI